MPITMIHILLGLPLHHLQAYPSCSQMLLLLAKPTSQECISLSSNLWQKNTGSFSVSLLAVNQKVGSLSPPRDATSLSQLHFKRGWVTRNSLIPLPLASVGSNKGWQSLLPGTLDLLARPVGLMVTQASELNKNEVWIAGRWKLRVISKLNTSW